MEMSKQSRFSINYKLTIKIIACILVIGMAINFAIPQPQAHAEVLTIALATSLIIASLAFFGISVSVLSSRTEPIVDSFTQRVEQYTLTNPIPSTADVKFLTGTALGAVVLMNPILGQWINGFLNWFSTEEGLSEFMVNPIKIDDFISDCAIYSHDPSPQWNQSIAQAIAACGGICESIPYDDGLLNVYVDNTGITYFYYNDELIFSKSKSYTDGPFYFYFVAVGNIHGYYQLSLASNNQYVWSFVNTNAFNPLYSGLTVSIPGEYTEIPQQTAEVGTAITYTGAPSTSMEDFLEEAIEEIATQTYDPTYDTEYPIQPTPAEKTTWEDGALSFWQAVGGAISGGLSTAGQSVRSWIQSLHDELVQYWEAILDWCDGIVGAIEGAEDGFIRGIINEISSVFDSVKSTLRSALGIWHYVVDWLRSIAAPFNLFLGLAGRVSPYITLPVYASISGLVILGVYKKFIG